MEVRAVEVVHDDYPGCRVVEDAVVVAAGSLRRGSFFSVPSGKQACAKEGGRKKAAKEGERERVSWTWKGAGGEQEREAFAKGA
eukprot:2694833-Rhodomonas_salina.3